MALGHVSQTVWKHFVVAIIMLAGSWAPGYAQRQCTNGTPQPQNLSFAEGLVAVQPPGWLLGPEYYMPPHEPVYVAETLESPACIVNQRCATVRSLRADPQVPLAFLHQDLDATNYRGQELDFIAQVRVQTGSTARLLVRVHRRDCTTLFFDNMRDHLITSTSWAQYRIRTRVDDDATHIEFGMQLIGLGQAWIDGISMETLSLRR